MWIVQRLHRYGVYVIFVYCNIVNCEVKINTLFALLLQVDQNHYMVPSATSELEYNVSMTIGCCTCAVGVTGALCKHQNAVLNKFGHHESFPHVTIPQMRRLYHQTGTGELSWMQFVAAIW